MEVIFDSLVCLYFAGFFGLMALLSAVDMTQAWIRRIMRKRKGGEISSASMETR